MNIAVFASGGGSNFQAILDAIRLGALPARACLLLSNLSDAGALNLARERGVPTLYCSRKHYASDQTFADAMLSSLRSSGADFIALAGYLKRVPTPVVAAFRDRISNIHPALLPSFGGHGMFGHHVHEAVIASGAKVSGATVHLVDEEYDRGPIVAQRCVPVLPNDTPDTLAERVLVIEHELYPMTLKAFSEGRVRIDGRRAWIAV
ncbi:MAG: phosphoribosylglycinamide formyltransferase [Ignavibacteria bacterium RIFCSPLOWO2_02_FULL_55_14]|nr:MAG: phosphoribosylglycinamide formyltransferase [Ignavibacteria bacterium GWC2_56_12]OGU67000.1 MAG: phosphoribosylglycinamide formyltransferase [Ignavibacteria bacterium RIFCSPHIGHO2_02_FULL_56_12]OGU72503.1 MAG: phosphoribosylglycinamide formyltransferase [Ignavibacteria bacterium RIFCSPLOWO2_02_FULL_55_14]